MSILNGSYKNVWRETAAALYLHMLDPIPSYELAPDLIIQHLDQS